MSLYVILMGVQGAGKGLQARRIEARFGIPQVSTGDLFRAMRTRQDALALKVQDIMTSGRLVDDDTTNEVARDRLSRRDVRGHGAILDGYPRNTAQAAFLDATLEAAGEEIAAVLLLDLDPYVAFKRAFGRVSANDGSSYNYYYKANEVDFCWTPAEDGAYPPRLEARLRASGEALKRRPDDASADAIVKRIDTYYETTQPLIDYYRDRRLVRRIDADQSIDRVWKEILAALGEC